MRYKFNLWGWYDGTTENHEAYSTDVEVAAEAAVEGLPYPNWTGFAWAMLPYVTPEPIVAPIPAVSVDPAQWFIDLGPFFDRFQAAKMAVLTSTNPVAQAIVKDCQIRKWIDLQNPQVAQAIDALIAIGISGLDAALKLAILTTPVTTEENVALRRLYFR